MQRVPFLSYYLIIFQIVVLLTENCCREIEPLLKHDASFSSVFSQKIHFPWLQKTNCRQRSTYKPLSQIIKGLGSLETFRKT